MRCRERSDRSSVARASWTPSNNSRGTLHPERFPAARDEQGNDSRGAASLRTRSRGCGVHPLTPRAWLDLRRARWGAVCGLVVLALRLGAVPISVRDFVMNARQWLFWTTGDAASPPEFPADHGRYPPAAHPAGDSGGRGAFGGGRQFSSAAAESSGRSVRLGRFKRRGAGCDHRADRRAAHAGLYSACGLSGRHGHHRRRLFPGPPRRATRQRHAAAGRDHHRIFSFRDHHVPDDHAGQPRPARHGLLADGRSLDGAARRAAVDSSWC